MVVVALIGVLAALAASQFLALKPRDQLRAATKDLTVSLRQARTIAITGSAPTNVFPWLVDRVAVVFDEAAEEYRMQLFSTDPLAAPNPLTYKVVRLTDYNGALIDLTITNTGPADTLNFERNGGTNAFTDLTLRETQSNEAHRVTVSRAGLARVAN